MPRAYRPSPNELERLLREETEKRKRMRLLQVRELSRMHALRMRNSYKSELNRQVNKLVDECRAELLDDKENKMRSMREVYDKTLLHRGEGHDLAKEWTDPQWAKMAAQEEAEVRAKERFRLALDAERERRAEEEAEASEAIRARQAALQVERERAKFLASLPPPPPAPYEAAINGHQGRPVTVCDRGAMNTTHIHTVPDHYAVEAVEPWSEASRGPDARAKAIVEEERLAALRQRTVVSLEENVVKAHMRGKEAIRRELVHQDYNNMINELNGLARGDLARRQRGFQRLPSRLFAVPHRVGHEARMDERQRERGFETAFAEQLVRSKSGPPSGENGEGDDEESGGGQPRPQPAFQPASPTKVRPPRRRKPPQDEYEERGGDGDNRRFVGAHEAPKRPPEAALPQKQVVRFQPDSKEETLQRLYQRIRSQRDKWLDVPEPMLLREERKSFPERTTDLPDYSPFDGISSAEEEEVEEEMDKFDTEEEVRSSVDSQERKRAPGQRPPMIDLEAVSRLRADAASKIRSRARPLLPEEEEEEEALSENEAPSGGNTESDRARLDAEMRELDLRIEELKRRGRAAGGHESEKNLKTYTIQRDGDLPRHNSKEAANCRSEAALVIPTTSFGPLHSLEREASLSGRSEEQSVGGSSLADVRAYQQRALARLASLTTPESSERDDVSCASSSVPPAARAAARNIEARLHKVELDLENERRRQAVLRQFLKQRAEQGRLREEEEPIVEPHFSQASVLQQETSLPYRPPTNHFEYHSSVVSRGNYSDPYQRSSTALNPFSEFLHESPPARLDETTPHAFSGSDLSAAFPSIRTGHQIPLSDFRPDSIGSKNDSKNPFLMSSTEPLRPTPSIPVDSHNPFLTSKCTSAAAFTNPFSSGSSNEVQGPTPEAQVDSRNPFQSCSSTEAPRQNSDLPLDFGLRDDSRNPLFSATSTDIRRPTSELPTIDSVVTASDSHLQFDAQSTPKTSGYRTPGTEVDAPNSMKEVDVFMDRERPPTTMTVEQLVAASVAAKAANSDVASVDCAWSGDRASDVDIHPDEPSFGTHPSNKSSVIVDEKKCRGDAAFNDIDLEATSLASHDLLDSYAAPSMPAELDAPLSSLPLRLRPRPPAMLDPQNELSRITEVDTPASMSGVTLVDDTEVTLSPSELKSAEEQKSSSLRLQQKSETATELQEEATDRKESSEISKSPSEAQSEAKNPEELRAAFLREYLLSNRGKLSVEIEVAPEDQSASEPNSLSQHTATGSDLSSSHGRSFQVLPTLEPHEGTLAGDSMELSLEVGSVHMSQHPCFSSTLTGDEGFPQEALGESSSQASKPTEKSSAGGLTQLLDRPSGTEVSSDALKSGLAQLTDRPSSAKSHELSQLTTEATNSRPALSLTQISVSDTAHSRQVKPNLTQHTASTLSSGPMRSLSQHPTTGFESSEQLAPSSAAAPSSSLTQVPTSNLTSASGTVELSSGTDCRALTQVSTALGSAGVAPSLEQDPVESSVPDEPCSLTQYPVSSFMDLSRPLSQFHDLEDSKEGEKDGNYEDTLQALDFSLPSAEVAPSKSEAPSGQASQVAVVALPVLSEASLASGGSGAESSSGPAPSIDRLIARSRQLRQENNSSLLRDDLLDTGDRPDWSLRSSSDATEGRPLTQMETKLLSENEGSVAAPEAETELVTVDSDSVVSFLRHEQELCRDSLSCRGSSESGSLQAAYATHKARLGERNRAQEKEKRKEAVPAKEKEGSLEDMQKTLASWKAERLQRKVSGKALVKGAPAPRSSASTSTNGSSDNVVEPLSSLPQAAKPPAEEDANQRTKRLWRQLEEVKKRAKEEEVRREREQNRAKGRAFSERMRAQRLGRGKKPPPSGKLL